MTIDLTMRISARVAVKHGTGKAILGDGVCGSWPNTVAIQCVMANV